MPAHALPAGPADYAAIARIYNQGMDDRCATFGTRHRSPEEIAASLDGELGAAPQCRMRAGLLESIVAYGELFRSFNNRREPRSTATRAR